MAGNSSIGGNLLTPDDFKKQNRLESVLASMGYQINGKQEFVLKCPFHEDKSPSFSVSLTKQLWTCFAGCGGGSVIDLIAKRDNLTVGQVLNRANHGDPLPAWKPAHSIKESAEPAPVLEKIYTYEDAFGKTAYEVLRYKPKTFRQRHKGDDDKWVWNMADVTRVLYRLPEIQKSQMVAIAEGEKDAETLVTMGYCGTCHVGGSKNWLPAYAQSLAGKDLVLFHDNDEPGEEWKQRVFDDCAGVCKTIRIVSVPKLFKDVSDYVASFKSVDEAKKAISDLVDVSHPFIGGVKVPIYSLAEMEGFYAKHCTNLESESLNLNTLFPSLSLRRLMPGELVVVLGDTGTGKTAILTQIAIHTKLTALMFQMELSLELLFERTVASKMKFTCRDVEANYASGDKVGPEVLNKLVPNLYFCSETKLTVEQIEQYIIRSELKIGHRPKLVLIDYAQLCQGRGNSRYERISNVAEDLRIMAKATRTIVILTSQVGRKEGEEVGLHSAKDSGSIENSASLLLGAWRDDSDPTLLHLKVLKGTKGSAGRSCQCNFDGSKMQISERI